MKDVSRTGSGPPAWLVVAGGVVAVLAVIWVVGLVISAISFVVKLAVSVGLLVLVAWVVVTALTGGRSRRS